MPIFLAIPWSDPENIENLFVPINFGLISYSRDCWSMVSIGILFIDRSRQGINNVAPQLAERRGADHRVTTPRGGPT